MSDQQPVYSPPPDYVPPPTPPSPDYPSAGSPPPVPPKKKSNVLIIGIVVGVLLLCCCLASAAGAWIMFAPSDTEIDGLDILPEEEGPERLPNNEADPRLREWVDWAPDSPAMLDSAPGAADALIIEGLAVAAPDFSYAEGVWTAGSYDAASDWYSADGYYVRAIHPSTDDVSAAVELWVQSDQMLAESVPFEPEENDVVTTIAGGARELLYKPQWGNGFELDTDEEVALWQQIGRDWPDAVVTAREAEDGAYRLTITKWPLYAVSGDYPIVSVLYEEGADGWELLEWEYLYPDDSSST